MGHASIQPQHTCKVHDVMVSGDGAELDPSKKFLCFGYFISSVIAKTNIHEKNAARKHEHVLTLVMVRVLLLAHILIHRITDRMR